jgi:hypothetical protein
MRPNTKTIDGGRGDGVRPRTPKFNPFSPPCPRSSGLLGGSLVTLPRVFRRLIRGNDNQLPERIDLVRRIAQTQKQAPLTSSQLLQLLLRERDTHKSAEQSYMEEGIRLLELAQSAHKLFVRQPAFEKRRLLNFVLSHCVLKKGELTATFLPPTL